MKTIFLLMFCFLFPFLSQAQDQTKNYTDEQLGFSLNFPSSWSTRPNYLGTSVMSFSPAEDPSDPYSENMSVIAETLPGNAPVQKYYEMYLSIMQRTLKNFNLTQTVPGTVDHQEAIKIIFSHTSEGGLLTTEELFVTKNNKGFVITCSALTTTFPKYQPEFEKTIQSLKLQ